MPERLDSWKDICQHLKRDRRTLQRWEHERGLPIHRVPGGGRPRVYALTSELDAWLRGSAPAVPLRPRDSPPSIAVLPFVNLSPGKGGEYFGDGLADDIINALTRIPGLRVTARTSSFAFRGKVADVRSIGARLNAATLIEGSVRQERRRIRVSAQLVSAADGYHLWSETYDRSLTDIFAIQDEIARAIASALSLHIGRRPLVRPPTANLEAYELWLKGRSVVLAYTPESTALARECFQEALLLEPSFPLPYLSLAEMMWGLTELGLIRARTGLEEVRRNIDHALALDDSLGVAHALKGVLRGVLDFDWDAAGLCFERALDAATSSPLVWAYYGWNYLHILGRLPEAAAALLRALELDPLSPLLYVSLGLVRFSQRDFPAAAASFESALELHPGSWWARFFLGNAVLFEGDAARGLALCQAALAPGFGPICTGALAAIHGLAGDRDSARRLLDGLLEADASAPVTPMAIAWACLGAGDDRVFEWLARTIEAREPAILHLTLPIYDSIRSDPRFAALLCSMRLPA